MKEESKERHVFISVESDEEEDIYESKEGINAELTNYFDILCESPRSEFSVQNTNIKETHSYSEKFQNISNSSMGVSTKESSKNSDVSILSSSTESIEDWSSEYSEICEDSSLDLSQYLLYEIDSDFSFNTYEDFFTHLWDSTWDYCTYYLKRNKKIHYSLTDNESDKMNTTVVTNEFCDHDWELLIDDNAEIENVSNNHITTTSSSIFHMIAEFGNKAVDYIKPWITSSEHQVNNFTTEPLLRN